MLGSISKLIAVAATALAFAASVQAQAQVGDTFCGGNVTPNGNGTLGTFSVQYAGNLTLVTINGLNNNPNTGQYILYCGDEAPGTLAVQSAGFPAAAPIIKVPVQTVAVQGTYTSSYIELGGNYSAIRFLDNPHNIVSPCLQEAVNSDYITDFSNPNATQESLVFQENQGIPQNIWVPSSREVDPLLRIEYITAVSLFFNNGTNGELMYSKIKAAYQTLATDMARIPDANKKRIAWVLYDFSTKQWNLRNSLFTNGIITSAGGKAFPLNVNVSDYTVLSAEDIKTVLLNAQIVIDQTDFTGQQAVTTVQLWMNLAGFTSSSELPVLANKQVYTLDNTVNTNGISDYEYRLASRPDLLLRDLIYFQYPQYYMNNVFNPIFMNRNFASGTGPTNILNASSCGKVAYNSGDIPNVVAQLSFTGDGSVPPPLVGTGIYGAGGSGSAGQGGSSGGKKTGIIVAIICVAAVMGAAFAFAFFKWSRRAKEDRFIELEEEMNNEIPLH